jgi:integrase
MGKRGNNEGTIYRSKDRAGYRAAYTVHTANGSKRRYISGKTRKEVAEKLAKATADRDGGLVFDAGSLRLGEYLERWLYDSVRDTVRQRTWERYEQIIRVHLTPALGKLKLKNLAPTHMRGLYREKLDSGLSPRTVNYIHTTLHKALKDAVADGLIPRNAASAVKAPRPKKKEIRPLSSEQARAFLEAARGDRFEALYVLAVHCGLRKGELLGLRWDDLDLEGRALSVRRTLSESRSGHIFEPPKNGKGRSVKLTSQAVEALRGHLQRQLAEIQKASSLYRDLCLVFPTRIGSPMSAQNLIGRSFKPLLKRAGLPHSVRLHDLRHTCATLLLVKGVHPKIVQELLGHATIAITLDTYSHVLPNMQSEAVSAMETVLL